MTPAECNEKYYSCNCGEIYKSRNLVAHDCPLHSVASEEALEAYAESETVAFTEWGVKNQFYLGGKGQETHWFREDGECVATSIPEMYRLFKQSQLM